MEIAAVKLLSSKLVKWSKYLQPDTQHDCIHWQNNRTMTCRLNVAYIIR